MRAFLGIWPDEATRDALDALERPAVDDLRWTTRDQWHVTLRFLGELGDHEVDPLLAALRAEVTGEGRVRCVAGPDTVVLGRRILAVPVVGVDDLARRVLAVAEPFGSDHPDEPFRGHLTLARARRRVPAHLVGWPLAATWSSATVDLIESRLEPGGARYETVGRVPLH